MDVCRHSSELTPAVGAGRYRLSPFVQNPTSGASALDGCGLCSRSWRPPPLRRSPRTPTAAVPRCTRRCPTNERWRGMRSRRSQTQRLLSSEERLVSRRGGHGFLGGAAALELLPAAARARIIPSDGHGLVLCGEDDAPGYTKTKGALREIAQRNTLRSARRNSAFAARCLMAGRTASELPRSSTSPHAGSRSALVGLPRWHAAVTSNGPIDAHSCRTLSCRRSARVRSVGCSAAIGGHRS